MAGYIGYETKNGIQYATYCVAKRIAGKKINETIYLGKVIDKERGIYQNRKQGKITFTPEQGI